MPDEIKTSISLQVAKGGAAIATGTLSGSIDMSGTDMATFTQVVSTNANDYEALDVPADVTGDVFLVIKHNGGSGTLTISKDNAGSHVLSKIVFGEPPCLLCRVPSNALFVSSSTAGTPIQAWISEA